MRMLAALTVLVYHALYQWLDAYPRLVALFNDLSHAAVIVFFVLSGYLIAYTTTSNNRGPRQYAVARLSRLYSMVVPALFITAIIEVLVHQLTPELAAEYTRGNPVPRYALCLAFCNEIGLFSASPPINNPLWSLSYEFWYYTIFGLWFYRGAQVKSLLLPLIACLIAGPKILLLLPIWLLGFAAYRLPTPRVAVGTAWVLVFGFTLVAGLVVTNLPGFPYVVGYKPFFYANQFVSDWVIGVLFALAVWFLPAASASTSAERGWVSAFRAVADLSFPLYILHYPLLILWRAVFGWRMNDMGQMWLAIIGITLVAGVIGLLLERQRGLWIRFFKWGMGRLKPRRVPLASPVPQLEKVLS
ncbi:acyltransferase family protein [Hymenobacter bucti]|uniref:Acyltransferase family protein n=1 Tax=Hymenobacter bucti TaxID=1844114 RepID=A0ABW4R0S8_9BACT